MQLLVGRVLDARARGLSGGNELLDLRLGQRRVRIEGDRFQRPLDLRELRLEAGHRLAEDADPLEQPDDIAPIPDAGRK